MEYRVMVTKPICPSCWERSLMEKAGDSPISLSLPFGPDDSKNSTCASEAIYRAHLLSRSVDLSIDSTWTSIKLISVVGNWVHHVGWVGGWVTEGCAAWFRWGNMRLKPHGDLDGMTWWMPKGSQQYGYSMAPSSIDIPFPGGIGLQTGNFWRKTRVTQILKQKDTC